VGACKAAPLEAPQGLDEEAVKDDDDDDDDVVEEEEDDIPWDDLARDHKGSSSQPSMLARVPPSPTLASTQQGEDARTEVMDAGRDTLLGAPMQAGGPKQQRVEEAELGSGGPDPEVPSHGGVSVSR
jgi:hypothetical protein